MTAAVQTYDTDDDLWPFAASIRPQCYTYLVSWPGWPRDVVKVGISERPARWRRFISTGARVDLIVRADTTTALEIEARTRDSLRGIGIPAFNQRDEAADYLPNGGGYTDCFMADRREAIASMKEVLLELVQGG